MKGEKTNIKYSTEDIRKYLDGQLSEQEMQALEKAALEDPFLADAMEGIEESRNYKVSFESGVEDLQKRLTERIREKNRVSTMVLLFSKWRIAASIIFILGIAVLALTYVNRKTRKTEIAKSPVNDSGIVKADNLSSANKTDSSVRPSLTEHVVISDSDKSDIALNQKVIKETKMRPKRLLSLKQNKVPDSPMIKPAENQVAYMSKPLSDSITKPPAVSSIANDDVARITMDSEKRKAEFKTEGFARSEYRNPSGNYIKGVVTDDRGNPIPFADVSIKGAKKSVFTDKAGFFKLYTIDPGFATQVMISSSGYEPTLELLKPDSSYTNHIKLTPASTALNEVTITGYGIAKKRDVTGSIMKVDTQNVNQVSGWVAFRNYIDSNKKILTADSIMRGDEIISFVVNNKSELSSFKIEKSLSPVHDAEIIRLIKAAPPLNLIKGKKKRLRLSITFN
ncbi:MAG TPA: carboxypeptidase-like regulatory domain-containing protein [Puia sp.]|nr:carboxypeptidase-like regulatory domain-containing protein [Puia sp.]